MATLGNALRAARKSLRMTLGEVKAQTGISVSFLSDVERGITNPSIGTLQKLAKCYHIPVDQLLKDVNFGVDTVEGQYPSSFKEFEASLNACGIALDEDMKDLLLQVEYRARHKTATVEDWYRRYYFLKGEIE